MKKRFTEEQIIRVIKEQESGTSVDEICRRHGIANSTFYKWKSNGDLILHALLKHEGLW